MSPESSLFWISFFSISQICKSAIWWFVQPQLLQFFANENFVVFELTNQHCSHHLCNVFVLMTFFCSTVSFNWMIWSWFVLTICAPNIAFPTTNQLCGPNSKIEIMWHFQQNPFRFEKTTTPNLLTGGTNHRKMNVLSFNNAMMTAL